MFSAPLEVKFYFGSIRENFGQHLLTNMSLKAPKMSKYWKMAPQRSVALKMLLIVTLRILKINHINSENVVKEFKKLTKARKSWKQNVSKRGSKRKSGDIKQNVKRFKVKPELT